MREEEVEKERMESDTVLKKLLLGRSVFRESPNQLYSV